MICFLGQALHSYKFYIHSSVAQTKNAQEKLEDDLYEMSKPLARYADDKDLEKMLKEREREGDPMLAFIKKKKTKLIKTNQREKPKKG